MKTCIVCYSLTGNVKYAAEKAARLLEADTLRIDTVKPYPDRGLAMFFHGGKDATFGSTPKLKEYTFEPGGYDRIVLACPVWVGKIAAPMRTFITENMEILREKEIYVLLCFSGGGDDKAMADLEKLLGEVSIKESVVLTDPKKRPSPENEKKLADFVARLK